MVSGRNTDALMVARHWLAAVLCFALVLTGSLHLGSTFPAFGQGYHAYADNSADTSPLCSQAGKISHSCCANSAGCSSLAIQGDRRADIVLLASLISRPDEGPRPSQAAAPPHHPPRHALSV